MKKKFYLIIIICILMLFTYSSNFLANEEIVTTFEEAGTYPVEIWYEDEKENSVKRIVFVTIKFKNTIISEFYSEGIDAYDIQIEKGVYDTLSDKELIALTNARAWNTNDGSHVPIVEVQRISNDRIHQVIFLTGNETMVTINVVEQEKLMEEFFVSESYFSPDVYIKNFRASFEMTLLTILIIPTSLSILGYFIMSRRIKVATQILTID